MSKEAGSMVGSRWVQAALYEEIRRLKVELDWLKRKHELVGR